MSQSKPISSDTILELRRQLSQNISETIEVLLRELISNGISIADMELVEFGPDSLPEGIWLWKQLRVKGVPTWDIRVVYQTTETGGNYQVVYSKSKI